MHGPSHLLISWFVAEAHGLDSPRDRRIVALSGFAPDIDVLAYAGAIVYFGFDKDLAFENWQAKHKILRRRVIGDCQACGVPHHITGGRIPLVQAVELIAQEFGLDRRGAP